MSLYNVLRTGVSGMEAQSFKLATVADNIANASTVGYKRADTEFSSLILDAGEHSYSSGAVNAEVRYEISRQGALTYTTSKTDLAVQGDGFFVVEDGNGGTFLTRAGSFVLDGESGSLVNAAGYALLGFPSDGEDPVLTLNDTAGLSRVNFDFINTRAQPSTEGLYRANIPAEADVVAAPTAAANDANSGYTVKSSVVAFDDLGREITLDVYWTKTADYDPNTGTEAAWEIAIYDQSTADPTSDTGFPYTNPDPALGGGTPAPALLSNATVTFDPADGSLSTFNGAPVDPNDPTTNAVLNIPLPNAEDPLALDITQTSQLAADFEPLGITINGNKSATVTDVSVDQDGRVFALYEDGQKVEFYRLPLATVASPDQLEPLSGNIYSAGPDSGNLRVGLPNDAGYGSLVVGAVENSNVDLASELTDMIESQRNFSANSKSFQAGNELLEVVINLKR